MSPVKARCAVWFHPFYGLLTEIFIEGFESPQS